MSTSKVKTTSAARGFLEWVVIRSVAWKVAGVRDTLATRRANKTRDIIR